MSSYTDRTYIVFLELPRDISEKIDIVRSKYSSSYKKYPAHITLKQDEDYLIPSDEICRIVYKQIKSYVLLNVKIKSPAIAVSEAGWNIYLPARSDDLRKLTKKISKSLENYIDPKSPRAFLSTKWEQSDKFYAHISIKGGNIKVDPKDILAKIKKDKFGFDFPKAVTCKTVTIANWQGNKWEKVKSFNLKNV